MWSHLERKRDGSYGRAASTPRSEKSWKYVTRLYSVRLTNFVREALEDLVPPMGRSRWVEAAILYCIQVQKDERLTDPFTAHRAGQYVGFCKGVAYACEETADNIDAEIGRLWAAYSREIEQSPPRHFGAPMPERMMSMINRPLGEILGQDPIDGPPDALDLNNAEGVPHPASGSPPNRRDD